MPVFDSIIEDDGDNLIGALDDDAILNITTIINGSIMDSNGNFRFAHHVDNYYRGPGDCHLAAKSYVLISAKLLKSILL